LRLGLETSSPSLNAEKRVGVAKLLNSIREVAMTGGKNSEKSIGLVRGLAANKGEGRFGGIK